jgi:prepilin-type N-terminal cleavage/methylation domain-containing protein
VILFETESLKAGAGIPSNRSLRAGFSLIEVLLALAIFLLAVVAIGRLVDMGIDRQIESRLKIRGARLAQSKMAEVVSGSQGQGQAPTSGSGTFDNDDSDFSWDVTADLQTPQNLYLVTVTVKHSSKLGEPFVLAQMVFNPLMMGSAQAATATTDQGSATPPASSGTPPTNNSTGSGSGGTP